MKSIENSLENKVAIVTGGTRGIGRAITETFLEAGAKVLVCARTLPKSDISISGRKAHFVSCDVRNTGDMKEVVELCESKYGKLDILVNNAGMQHRGPLESFEADVFDQMIAVNLKAAFYTAKALSAFMIARQHGRIINIASVMSLLARPGIAPYTATKGAIANLTKGMAADWAGYGLNCNAIAPGYFKTELNAALVADKKFTAWLERRTPAGRWGDVSDLVGTAVYLASPASSFVNGQIIYVDGGLTATV